MRAAVALSLAGLLSGCSLLAPALRQSESLVSADPLAITVDDLRSPANLDDKKEFLGRVVYESEQKCVSFLNRLVLAKNTVDTSGDIVAAALSGVGALVTPLATAHALSGAATFVTGAKSTVNADIYANASISNFQIALQQSYFKYMLDYTRNLPSLSATDLVVSNEVAKIQSIHGLCGLAPAEASIQATITKGSGPPPPETPNSTSAPPPVRSFGAPERPRSRGISNPPSGGAATHGAVLGAPLF